MFKPFQIKKREDSILYTFNKSVIFNHINSRHFINNYFFGYPPDDLILTVANFAISPGGFLNQFHVGVIESRVAVLTLGIRVTP